MSTITKEWLQKAISQHENMRDEIPFGLDEEDSNTLAALRIALASLEAEAVAWMWERDGKRDVDMDNPDEGINRIGAKKAMDAGWKCNPLYTAPPAPANSEPVAWLWSNRKHPSEVSLVRPEDDERAEGAHWSGWSCQALYAAPPTPVSLPTFEKWCELNEQKPVGWVRDAMKEAYDGCRAAMLHGADGTLTNEGTITATQFKPVADLYGLTSPTGSETSFTFDAVEARDFVDGGWSCQEYVELERFQEAITNHTEDKLAMVDHSGDSNNMVEPVTTANELPFEQWLSQQTGTIDVECGCVMTEVFFHWLRVAYEAGNSPVIQDGWVMLPAEPTQAMMNAWLSEVANWRGHAAGYRAMIAAAPQQEVKP